jgi:hypothetical protein
MREPMINKDLERLLASEADRFESEAAKSTNRRFVRARSAEAPAQVYSVRIPVDRLEDLRRLAERDGMQPSSMLREWILERLEQEQSRSTPTSEQDVADAYARQVVLGIARAARDYAERLAPAGEDAARNRIVTTAAPVKRGSAKRTTAAKASVGGSTSRASAKKRTPAGTRRRA